MKDYLRNLFAARGAAFWLNLLGLSLAFVIFYVLMAEVMWHVTFDRFHKDADRVCQVFHKNKHFDSERPEKETFIAPVMEAIVNSTQQFEASVGVFHLGVECGLVPMDEGEVEREPINTMFRLCTSELFNVFTFDVIEGDTGVFRNTHNVFIPLSLAKKLYGEEGPYVGRRCGVRDAWDVVVGGVYRDFPTNSQLPNDVYQRVNEQQRELLWSDTNNWNHRLFVKLRKGADGEQISEELLANSLLLRENSTHFSFIPLHETYFLFLDSGTVDFMKDTGMERVFSFYKRNGSHTMVAVLALVAMLVIFIAAINYVNFSMSMVPYQIKEVNVRRIFGARVSSLRSTLLCRAFVNVGAAVLLALLVLIVIIQLGILDEWLKCDLAFSRNAWTLCLMALLAVLLPVFAGGYPAWYVTSRKPAMVVNGSFALSPAGRAFRRGLIGFQFAVSMGVILVLLLFLAQYHYMYTAPVGYDRDEVFYAEAELDDDYERSSKFGMEEMFLSPMMQALRTNPAVSEVAWGSRMGGNYNSSRVELYKGEGISYDFIPVEYNFLKVMGIKVISGRDFRPEDRGHALLIFNEKARKKYNLELNEKVGNYEIIGFTEDIHTNSLKHEIRPTAFVMGGSFNYNIVVRLASPDRKAEVCRFIEEQGVRISNGRCKWTYYTADDVFGQANSEEMKQLKLLLLCSIVSLLIPLIGVFGLVLFETRAKRKEIGIRKVFGATTKGILLMFNAQYLRILVVCFVIAVPVALQLYHNWIQSFAYRTPMHWWLFGVAFLLVAAIVCLTVTVQSWRAAKEKPVDTIMK